jgi:hypothetical protein
LGWAEICHPFHPLRGQRFPVLKKRRIAGNDTLILRGLDCGTFSRDAQNAENGKIAPNWNVSGTRTFQPAGQFREARSEEATRKALAERLEAAVCQTHLPCSRSPISKYFQEFTLLSVAVRWPHLPVKVHQECTKNTASPHSLERDFSLI